MLICGVIFHDLSFYGRVRPRTQALDFARRRSDYRGKASDELNKLVFNNGNPARTLTVLLHFLNIILEIFHSE